MLNVSVERFLLFYLILNFCLLYLTGLIIGRRAAGVRLLGGAAVLALYLTAEYLAGFGVWTSAVGRALVSWSVISLAFAGAGLRLISRSFFLLNMLAMLVSGIFFSLSGELTLGSAAAGILLLAALLAGVLLPVLRQRQLGLCRVRLELLGRAVELNGLPDSGNLLYAPLSLLPVLVADYRALLPLFEANGQAFLCRTPPQEWLSSLDELSGCIDGRLMSRLSLVEARSVGGSRRLISFRLDRLSIIYPDGVQRTFSGVAALTDELGGCGYEALLHSDFLR